MFLCFSVWSSLFLLFLIKRWYSFDRFQPFLRPKRIAGVWTGRQLQQTGLVPWLKEGLGVSAYACWTFSYWGLLLLVVGDRCMCVRRTCDCFWLLQLVPFSPSFTLHIQAYHFPSLNLCFYCLSLSLFLTFRSLSSSTALVLRFFFFRWILGIQ